MSGYGVLFGHKVGALCCLSALLVSGCGGDRADGDGASRDGYTTLDAINESNPEPLSVAWAYETGATFTVAPLVAGGVLYADADGLGVHAVSAQTGQKLWYFDANVPESARQLPVDRWGRGVALREGRVYVTARDGRLIALDVATGAPAWQSDTCPDCPEGARGATSAPRVAGDHIVVATAGTEGTTAHLVAFGADTGKEAWRVMEPAAAAGSSWGAMAYDPGLRRLYVSAGGEKPSISSIDPQTGLVAWSYPVAQAAEHAGAEGGDLMLADLTIDGARRQVIMHPHADGQFLVLDRTDGKQISIARYAETGGVHLEHTPVYSPKVGLVYLPIEASGTRYLQTWNPVSAQEQWRIVLEESTPCGGLLSTAGNLLIQGDSAGYLNVFEAEWGEVRARVEIDACATGAPFSYSIEGVQYIGTFVPGKILALKLGGREVKEPRDMKRYPKTIRPERES